MRAHARKCEKGFACNLKQHLWNTGHVDLNSHFKKLNTLNTSLTFKEPHKPKHTLSTMSFLAVSSFALKLMPCFRRFSKIFTTNFLVQTLISQPNVNQIKRFMDQNLSWLVNCKLKTGPILEIKDLLFMLRSIKQRAFLMTQSIGSTYFSP